jgi:hypothetical protein
MVLKVCGTNDACLFEKYFFKKIDAGAAMNDFFRRS